MYRKTFVCLCRQTTSRIYTIFNTVQSMSDINNIYINFKIFEKYLREFERAQTDRQTGKPNKHFSTLLESVKKE